MGFPVAGGVGLATETDGGTGGPLVPVDYFPDMLREAAQQAWSQYHDELTTQLGQLLGTGDLITSGITLYDIDVNIADDVALSIDRDDSGDLLVHLTTGGCSISATSTQPTVLGKWADPRFSFDFALELTYRIDLPPTTGALHATGFTHIRVLSPHIDSQNLVADVVFVFNDIWAFFFGDGLVQVLEQFIAGTDFASFVNPQLTPLNDKLQELAGQGFWFLTAVVDRLDGQGGLHGLSLPGAPADRLDLMLVARGYDRSGTIEGDITWPAALGTPVLPGVREALRATDRLFADNAMAAVSSATTTPAAAARVRPRLVAPDDAVFVTVADAVALNPQPLPPHDRFVTAARNVELQHSDVELRAGVASRFMSTIGAESFTRLATLFEEGPITFDVAGLVMVPGEPGQFASTRRVGHMARMTIHDDGTTCRRHYVLDQVPIGFPMPVVCSLAGGWVWSSGIDVACTPDHWDGNVTVRPAIRVEQRVDATREEAPVFGVGTTTRSRTHTIGEQIRAVQAVHAFDRVHEAPTVRRTASDTIANELDQHGALIDLALTRHDPMGAGTTPGIDFTVAELIAPVIR
ncbi:MAG: hypothetical protein JWM12_1659 [Ilumatobacteraceae bacterium]|nr:hypothetical protein [Ilumatobacteraceae bacterium]